jgi:6-phosphogluconolactonase
MKLVNKLLAFIITAGTLISCQKDKGLNTEAASDITAASEKKELTDEGENLSGKGKKDGYVYTLSNQTSGNTVRVYRRAENGSLTFNASYASGGNGTGGGLGNQGAVILSDDDMLLAVNAGSNSISSFKINNGVLSLKSTVSSGGMRPVSIAQHDDIVFVLNAGGTNNISGLKLKENGMLQPIQNSTRPLSAASTGPAQISFINGGKVLVITEKATNKIISYTVNDYGIPGAMRSIMSSSPTPFGFAVGKHENIFVSEAVGGAPGASVLSSYNISNNGVISLIDGSVGAGQSAACWVVVTNNGKFAYTTNTASNNISTFGVKNNGDISVSQAISATTQAGPIDAALSNNSKFLYVLNGAGLSIQGFEVAANGTLSLIQTVSGLPVGANGLAAD